MSIPDPCTPSRYMLPACPFMPLPARNQVRAGLLVGGDISTPALQSRLRRLSVSWAGYLAYYPYGVWRRGLVVTPEMHRLTELHLPLAGLRGTWRAIVSASIGEGVGVADDGWCCDASSWLSVLERLHLPLMAAPHALFDRMLRDEAFRIRVLCAWFLPRHHGGGFDRYPLQQAWLLSWLRGRHLAGKREMSCLDVACGSGEGTYELAAAVYRAGFSPGEMVVRGTTLHQLAVMAAATGHFPHDPGREEAYRGRLERLAPGELWHRVAFYQEDLREESGGGGKYDVIQCNGLLGGPLLHGRDPLLGLLTGLAKRLAPGGLLLADDRFHPGWRKMVSREALRGLFGRAGLLVTDVPSGVAGVLPP